MKTVELKIGNKPAQFTTKSLTYNGTEYFYSKMSHVINDPENCNYAFAYDGQVIVLHYNPDDLRILNAIFSQVKNLSRQTHAGMPKPAAAQTQVPPQQMRQPSPSRQMMQEALQDKQQFTQPQPVQNPVNVPPAQIDQSASLQSTVSDSPAQEKTSAEPDAPVSKDELKAQKKAEKERLKAEKKAEKERLKAEKKGSAENQKGGKSPSAVVTNDDERVSELTPEEQAVRKAKIKRSCIIFGIIIAAFVLISAILMITFSSNSDKAMTPNSTQSQSYDDIDELINELQ